MRPYDTKAIPIPKTRHDVRFSNRPAWVEALSGYSPVRCRRLDGRKVAVIRRCHANVAAHAPSLPLFEASQRLIQFAHIM